MLMNKKTAKSLIDILYLAGKLKKTVRAGWVEKANISDPESVADHSYRVTILAALIGDILGLDADRMVRMALIHDLSEAVTGDITPTQIRRGRNKETEEKLATAEIFSKFPLTIRNRYKAIWDEFIAGKTKEAKILHELDAFEMAIQSQEYSDSHSQNNSLLSFKESAAVHIDEPSVKMLLDLI